MNIFLLGLITPQRYILQLIIRRINLIFFNRVHMLDIYILGPPFISVNTDRLNLFMEVFLIFLNRVYILDIIIFFSLN